MRPRSPRLIPVHLTLVASLIVSLVAGMLAAPGVALAAGTVSIGTGTYSQNFDSLANTDTSSVTPEGWNFVETGSNANGSYTAGTGSSNTGDTYSFGPAGSTERAFGGLQSGSLVPTIGGSFSNGTGATITALNIAYTGEQWRLGTANRADRLDFQYSLDATSLTTGTWTNVDALDFSSPVTTGTVGALDGNAAANRTAISSSITGLSIPAGAIFWLRWNSFDATNSDDGLAVDDFSLTAVTETAPPPPPDVAPTVTATTPASGATNVAVGADLSVTFSEPVTAASGAFTLSCGGSALPFAVSGGPTTFTVNPDADLPASATCTLTVIATNVSDQDGEQNTLAADVTVSFTTAAPPPQPGALRIRDIQGAALTSPLVTTVSDFGTSRGQPVTNVPGVVTAVASNGFYFQDPQPDTSDATSEGIFVFNGSGAKPAVGDSVLVTGVAAEFRPGCANAGSCSPTSSGFDNLTLTQIVAPSGGTVSFTVLSSGNSLPAPVVIGQGGRVPPTEAIYNDGTAGANLETSAADDFDPATEGLDFFESLEGMRVQVNSPVAVSPTNDFGEIFVLADSGAGAGLRTDRGGIIIRQNDFNPERIQIDDDLSGGTAPGVDVGAQLSTVVGVVSYAFGNFEVLPTSAITVAAPSTLPREVTGLVGDASNLTIATFNVENLDPSDGAAKFTALAAAIVNNLRSPDIIGLEEVQDNNGPTNDSVVDASVTYQTLISAIATAGGPTYEFRQINPLDDTNGGEPGGNIRVGFLFNPSRVSFVDRPGGNATTATAVTNAGGQPQISLSPGLIDPTNTAFSSSRKPLVGEFVFNGQTVFVIVNHWNSKGGDDPLYGRFQSPVLNTEAQRIQQATIVRDFVRSILAINANARVAVVGDLNDFEFSPPLTTLEDNGLLRTLIESLPEPQRYTYNFQGNAQSLDHIVVSNALFTALNGYDVVHINSEFAEQVSDHDPQVARFTLAQANRAPVANNDTATTAEDTAVTVDVRANDTDPDAQTLTVTAVGLAVNGTTAIVGNQVVYTPAPNFFGTDSFSYTVSDGALTANATVNVTVTPANDAPLLAAVATYDTGLGGNGAEIVSVRGNIALLTNAGANSVDVLDISDILSPTLLRRVSVPAGLNSVAIHPTLDLFLTVSGTANRTSTPGTLAAYRISDGVQLGTATVGIQPDSVGIAPNGLLAVVANEAEGVDAAPRVDGGPGSLSVVSLAGFNTAVTGQSLSVTQIPLPSYAGTPGFTVSRTDDLARLPITNEPGTLEPESVAFSADSAFAYITLQENNAVLRLDLATNALTPFGLGTTTRIVDTTNGNGYNPATRLMLFREPDGIAVLEIGGVRYFVTADEGDTRDGDASGRVRGGRTVSVYNANTGALVGDTGNQLDTTAARFGIVANADSLAVGYPDNRSDRGGAEPEVLDALVFNGRAIVAVGLERSDAVALVDITTPSAPVVFALAAAGNAPEGVKLVERDGQLYAFAANEVSGTLTVASVPVAPTVVRQSYTEDTPLPLRDLLGLDIDVAGSYTVNLSVNPTQGALNTTSASGTLAEINAALAGLVFTPAANFNGTATIGVTLSDGQASTTATYELTGTPVNDAPTITFVGGVSCAAGNTPQATVRVTVSDVDGDALTISLAGAPSWATATASGAGAQRDVTITLTPEQNNARSALASIRVSDGSLSAETPIGLHVGTQNDNQINAASGQFAGVPNVILGLGGQDRITGGNLADVICAGDGDNQVSGGSGDDLIVGGATQDRLSGGAGNDTIEGRAGDDQLNGGEGNDTLRGGDNNDRLLGEGGDDTLTGGNGQDFFDGGPGTDTATDAVPGNPLWEQVRNIP